MNNRILATLFALAIALFICVAPVEAEAAHICADNNGNCVCDYSGCTNVVHDLAKVDAKEPDHEFAGNIEHYACANCGKLFADDRATTEIKSGDEVLAKVEHDLQWEVTETSHKKYCTGCGYVPVASTAHTLSKKDNGDGTHTMKCTVEGCTYEVTAAHDDGTKKDCKCGVCGAEMEHSPSEWKNYPSDPTKHFKQCTVCAKTLETQAHEFEYAANEGDTHSEKCTICGETRNAVACADGEIVDHKCDACGDLLIHAYDRPYMSITAHKTATCTEDGIWLHKQCEVCGLRMKADGTILDETTMVNPKTGHSPNGVWEKDDEDVHYQWCAKNCGEHAVEEAHKPGECKVYPSDKTKHFNQCTVCYKSMNIEDHIDENKDCLCDDCGEKLQHTVEKVNWKAATCEEDGWIDHRVCTTCGTYFEWNSAKVLTAEEVILPAIKHQPNGKWETDDKDGHYQWCANDCGTKLLQEAHTAGEWKEYPSDRTKHFHQCTVCYKTLETEDHDYAFTFNGYGTDTHKAECKDCGKVRQTASCYDKNGDCKCDVCGGIQFHMDKSNMTYVAAKAPTCLEDGHTDYYQCNVCGGMYLSDGSEWDPYEGQEAIGHDWKYLKNTTNGQHLKRCNNCKEYTTEDHTDLTGDCLCDINNCGMAVHVHTIEHVEKVPAKCGVPGTEDYFIYQPCGRKLDKNLKDIVAPATIPALEHEAGDEYEAVDGDLHANLCKHCGEAMTTSAHADKNGDNRCDVCKVELALTYVPQQDPTCTDVGYEGYWISEVTGRKYADANGKQYITSVPTIPATGHDWTSSEDIYHVCGDCGLKQAHKASAESDCVCGICEMQMNGHSLTIVDAVAPTCTKTGTDAYIKCSCGALYDIDGYEIAAPAILYATGHVMGDEVKLDKAEGDHYIECLNCGYELHEDHKMSVEDPLKGNYHQWVCECGEVETAKHSDSDGDNKCDECKHVMTSTTVTVEQHDNKTVVTGDASTIKPTKSWWQNWLNNLKPGNASGSTGSKPAASESAPVVNNNQSAASSGSVNTGNNAPVNTNNNSTNIIGNFMQWLGQLFGALLR